jgi:hypothetical protein
MGEHFQLAVRRCGFATSAPIGAVLKFALFARKIKRRGILFSSIAQAVLENSTIFESLLSTGSQAGLDSCRAHRNH